MKAIKLQSNVVLSKKEFRISTNLFFFFLLQHEFTFKLCFNELSIHVLVLKASSATKYFFFFKCLKKCNMRS